MSHPPMNSVSDAREKSRGSPLRCEIKILARLDLLRQQFESGRGALVASHSYKSARETSHICGRGLPCSRFAYGRS
jgi:hypothetical protein